MNTPSAAFGHDGVSWEPFARLLEGLARLLRARALAETGEGDLWQFAVTAQGLRGEGLNDQELRVLALAAIVDHRVETTGPEDGGRRFRRVSEHVVVDRSCFVLTAHGFRLARSLPTGVPPAPERTRGA
jgi:hypothetical protein